MCVKLCIITRKVSRQIKNFFQRIEIYSSSFRMLKEFECTSYFKPTSRAFFNYITGGAKAPPAPMVAPPLKHFGPPSQSPFSLKYKQNMEFRREV